MFKWFEQKDNKDLEEHEEKNMEDENRVQSLDEVESQTKISQEADDTTETEQNELHRLRNLVNSQKEEIDTLKDHMYELQEFMEDEEFQRQDNDKNSNPSSPSKDVADEVEEMYHALQHYEISIAEKDKQIDQFQDMVNDFEELLDSKEKEIDELKKSLSSLHNEESNMYVCSNVDVDEEKEEKIRITEAEMTCSLRLYHDFMNDVEIERKKLFSSNIQNKLQDKISKFETHTNEMQQKNEVISQLEQENSEMKDAMNAKDDTITHLESVILLLNEKLAGKESTINSKTLDIQCLENDLENKTFTINAHKDFKDQNERKILQLNEKLAENNKVIESQTSTLETISLKNEYLEIEIQNKATTINKHIDTINNKESKIKELTTQLLLTKTGDMSEQEVTWLEDMEEKEIIITDLNNELSDKEIIINDINNELSDKYLKITDLEEQLGEKQMLLDDSNEELLIKNHSIQILQQKVDAQQEQIDFQDVELHAAQMLSNSISCETDLHKLKTTLIRVESSAAEKTEKIIVLNKIISNQKETIADLQAEVAEIRSRSQRNLSELIGKFDDRNNLIQSIQKESRELDDMICQLQTVVEEEGILKKDLPVEMLQMKSNVSQDLSALLDDIVTEDQSLQMLQKKMEDNSEDESSIVELQKNLHEKKLMLHNLKSQASIIMNHAMIVNELECRITHKDSKIQSILDIVDVLEETLDIDKVEMSCRESFFNYELTHAHNSYMEKMKDLQHALEEKCNMLKLCNDELTEKTDMVEQLQLDAERTQNDIIDIKYAMKVKLEDKDMLIQNLNNELAQKTKNETFLSNNLELCKEDIDCSQRELSSLQSIFHQYKTQHDDDLARKDDSLQQVESQLEKKAKEIASLNSSVVKYNHIISNLQSEMSELKSSNDDLEYSICELRHQVTEKNESVSKLNLDITELKSINEDLESSLDELRDQISDKNEAMSTLKSEMEILQSHDNDLESSICELRDELTMKNETISNITSEMAELKSSNDDLISSLYELTDQDKEKNEIISNLKSDIEESKSSNKDLEFTIGELREQVAEKSESISTLKAEVEDIKRTLLGREEEIKDLDDNLKQKEHLIQKLQEDIQETKSSNESLERRIKELQSIERMSKEKDTGMVQLKQLLTEKENLIAKLQGDMSELRVTFEEDMGEQEIVIGELKAELSLKDNEIILAHKIIEEQRERAKISDEELSNMQNLLNQNTKGNDEKLEESKMSIDHLKTKVDDKETVIGELKAALSLKDNEIKLAHNVIEELRERVKISNEESSNMQDLLNHNTKDNEKVLDEYKTSIQQLKTLIDAKDAEFHSSERTVMEQKDIIHELQTKILSLQSSSEQNMEDMTSEKHQIEERVQQLRELLQSEKSINLSLLEDIDFKEQSIDKLNIQLQEKEKNLNDLRQAAKEKENRIVILNKKESIIRASLEDTLSVNKRSSESLIAKLDDRREMLEISEVEVSIWQLLFNDYIKIFFKDMSKNLSSISSPSVFTRKLHSNLEDMGLKVQLLEHTLIQKENDISILKLQHDEQILSEMNKKDESLQQLHKSLDEKEVVIGHLKQILAEKKNELKILHGEISEFKLTFEEDLEEKKIELESCISTISELKNTLERNEGIINMLNLQVEDSSEIVHLTEAELNALSHIVQYNIKDLETRLKEKNESVARLESLVMEQKDELHLLNQEKKAKNNELIECLESDILQLRSSNEKEVGEIRVELEGKTMLIQKICDHLHELDITEDADPSDYANNQIPKEIIKENDSTISHLHSMDENEPTHIASKLSSKKPPSNKKPTDGNDNLVLEKLMTVTAFFVSNFRYKDECLRAKNVEIHDLEETLSFQKKKINVLEEEVVLLRDIQISLKESQEEIMQKLKQEILYKDSKIEELQSQVVEFSPTTFNTKSEYTTGVGPSAAYSMLKECEQSNDNHESIINEKEQHIAVLNQSLSEHKQLAQEREKEVLLLTQKLAANDKDQAVEFLETRITEKDSMIEMMKKTIDDKEFIIECLRKDVSRLADSNNARESNSKEVEAELHDKDDMIKELKSSCELLQEDLKKNDVELQNAFMELKETKIKLEEREKKINELEQDIKNGMGRAIEMTEKHSQLQQNLSTNEKLMSTLEERNAELLEKLEKLEKDLFQSNTEAQTSSSAFRKEIEEKNESIQDLEMVIQELRTINQDDADKHVATVERLRNEVNDKISCIQLLEKKLEELNTMHYSISTDFNNEISSYKENINTLEMDIDKKQETIVELENKINFHNVSFHELTECLDSHKLKIQGLSSLLDEAKYDLNRKEKEFHQKRKSLESVLKRKERDIDDLKGLLKCHQTAIKELSSTKSSANKSVYELQQEISGLQSSFDIHTLKAKVNAKDEDIKLLQFKIQEKKERESFLLEELRKFRSNFNPTERSNECRDDSSSNDGQILLLKRENEELRTQLDEYKMNSRNLQKTVSTLRNEIAARDQPTAYYDDDISVSSSLKRIVEDANDTRSTTTASVRVKEEENIFHNKITKVHDMMSDIEELLERQKLHQLERQRQGKQHRL